MITPTSDVMTICKLAELKLKHIRYNRNKMSHLNHINRVQIKTIYELFTSHNMFKSIYRHSFRIGWTVVNHITILTFLIINLYLKIILQQNGCIIKNNTKRKFSIVYLRF